MAFVPASFAATVRPPSSATTRRATGFWRLRHNGAANTTNFDVSADGQTWAKLLSVAATFPLDSMKVWLFAGAWGTGNASPGTAVYGGVKLTPNE